MACNPQCNNITSHLHSDDIKKKLFVSVVNVLEIYSY